jgi:hypothetical protein
MPKFFIDVTHVETYSVLWSTEAADEDEALVRYFDDEAKYLGRTLLRSDAEVEAVFTEDD